MKICSIASARPNFVKLAAVHHALSSAGIEHAVLHTGQHFDRGLSDVFFKELSIPEPIFNLGIHGGSREEVVDRTRVAVADALLTIQPDLTLVYGDVNGALGAAQGAKRANVPLGHIEAGLRSFDESMPEELNRKGIDALSDLLFVTERSGVVHLEAEHARGAIHFVGNTMIDTLIRMMPLIERASLPDATKTPFGVVTIHRPSNVDAEESLRKVCGFLNDIAGSCPLVFPVHARTNKSLQQFSMQNRLSGRIHMVEPMGYIEFLKLAGESAFILTDSGGIQEEAVLLQKRCFTLRKNTERPVTIDSGSNVLVDLDDPTSRAKVLEYAKNPIAPTVTIPELWDGRSGDRIAQVLKTFSPSTS